MLPQFVYNFLGVKAQGVIITKRVLVISETLTVIDTGQRRTQGSKITAAIARPSIVENLEDVRRAGRFVQVIVPPGKRSVSQPSRRKRAVIAQDPVPRSVRQLAEGRFAERVQPAVGRVAGLAGRIAEN